MSLTIFLAWYIQLHAFDRLSPRIMFGNKNRHQHEMLVHCISLIASRQFEKLTHDKEKDLALSGLESPRDIHQGVLPAPFSKQPVDFLLTSR
jgi:hypothetical protein